MQTLEPIPADRTPDSTTDFPRRKEPHSPTALLLPVPDPEDVAGFAILYQSKYGVELEPEQAGKILAGLMRFLYLTRRREPKPPPHPT